MAHLLVLESWVGASSVLLPRAIKELGHRFTFVTRDLQHYLRNPPAPGLHPLLLADNILTTETNDLPSLLAYLEQQHRVMGFDGVLTTCDYYLEAAALVANRLGLPGSSPEGVRTARTKHLMRQALEQAGLPNPQFRTASNWEEARAAAEAIGYPVVFKPTDLCAGMYVTCARDEAELQQAFERLAGFPVNARHQARPAECLIEELLEGEELSVETSTFQGATTVIGITDKPLAGFPAFVEAGHMFPARLAEQQRDAVAALARDALAATGYTHGVAHTEIRLTPHGPRIIEINVRQAGNYITELVRHVTGINISHAMVQLALGQRPHLTPQETGIRSAAIRFLLPGRAGTIASVSGAEGLDSDPNVVAWHLSAVPGQQVRVLRDNNDYLGHVIAVDHEGVAADRLAERAAGLVQIALEATP
ncbi:MAG: ATP-grasp domain-containing protein [Roseiflexaceae bacterium]